MKFVFTLTGRDGVQGVWGPFATVTDAISASNHHSDLLLQDMPEWVEHDHNPTEGRHIFAGDDDRLILEVNRIITP